MKKEGFTLVELIAVIVIIGVLSVILIPVISNASKNTKQKMLETKVETSSQALVVWAQNNRKCFFSDATSYGNTCLIGLNKNCTKNFTKENIVNCEVSYGELASFGIIKYDDESNNEVINPTNNNSMNSEKITLEYNLNTKMFCIGVGCSKDVTTTKKVIDIPQLIVNPESDEEWSQSKTIEVIVSGGTAGLAEGGSIEYGISESKTEEPTYTSYPLSYADGDDSTSFNVVGNNLSGKYYLWLKPNMSSKDRIIISDKIAGPYYLDNEKPSVPSMSYVYGDWTAYNGEWTNKNVYVAQAIGKEVATKRGPSGATDEHSGILKYQISKDNINWIDYNYDYNNEMYKITENGENVRYFRAVDKAGNNSESISVIAKIDKVEPTVSIEATKNGLNTKVASNTWSDTGLNFKLTAGTTGNSEYTIYYCKDTANTCNPGTSIANNTQITAYNTQTGEYYIRYKAVSISGASSTIGSYHAKVDTTTPTVKVTGYKYNASGTNKVGDKVVNQITYTGDATFTISDNWVNYGATFEFVNSSTSGIKSIVWKWNEAESSADTGNTYPSANASNQTSPFTTKYASLTGAGFRKGQWVVTNNAGKTTTITVVVKIDTTTPTVSIEATKNGLNTKVASNTWSDTGLNYKLTAGTTGNSGYTIYYCKDTANTCNPGTSIANNTSITAYNGVTGEYYIRYKIVSSAGNSSSVGSYHAKVDTSKPTVKVTGYKYNASGTNKVGDKVVNQITYTGDATFTISDNWVNYGATFEFVNSSTSGIKSIVWKWNEAGSSADTGNTYPSANASNQTSPFTTKYASITGAGFRKGQWVVTNNAGKTTTITVVVKIDTTTPTVSIQATKNGTSTTVATNTWSNTGLNFKLIAGTTGNSGYTIYYCKDTANTCNPGTSIANNTQITAYNTQIGEYYIRYKIVSGAGSSSSVGSYHAKADTCSSDTNITNGTWSDWGSCSKKCGTGTQTRTRTNTVKSKYGQFTCSTTTETGSQNCNTQTCCSSKSISSYGTWSNWSNCSNTCGTGTQSRSRTNTYKSNYDGSSCGTAPETQNQSCSSTSGCASINICNKPSTDGMYTDKYGNCRYAGSNPNNFVTFNDELWRIIGVIDVAKTNGGATEKRLKIKRFSSLGSSVWDDNNTNIWANSTLAKELNNNYAKGIKITSRYIERGPGQASWTIVGLGTSALNTTAQSLIDNAVWYVGKIKYGDGLSGLYTDEKKTTWIGKVGLTNVSDIYFASMDCKDSGYSMYHFDGDVYGYTDCRETCWMAGERGWTMGATTSADYNVAIFELNGYQGFYEHHVGTIPATVGVKPVVYLKANVKITGGSGTRTDPYTLSL